MERKTMTVITKCRRQISPMYQFSRVRKQIPFRYLVIIFTQSYQVFLWWLLRGLFPSWLALHSRHLWTVEILAKACFCHIASLCQPEVEAIFVPLLQEVMIFSFCLQWGLYIWFQFNLGGGNGMTICLFICLDLVAITVQGLVGAIRPGWCGRPVGNACGWEHHSLHFPTGPSAGPVGWTVPDPSGAPPLCSVQVTSQHRSNPYPYRPAP